MGVINSNSCIETQRKKAFDAFKLAAKQEKDNGAETLSLFRLVPQFSTAPKIETDDTMVCMRYWSRRGQGQALIEAGEELYNWAQDNGYHHN